MPHQFMLIDCSKCGTAYCPVCKDICPKCNHLDVADEKTMLNRQQMKRHMRKATHSRKRLKKLQELRKQLLEKKQQLQNEKAK